MVLGGHQPSSLVWHYRCARYLVRLRLAGTREQKTIAPFPGRRKVDPLQSGLRLEAALEQIPETQLGRDDEGRKRNGN